MKQDTSTLYTYDKIIVKNVRDFFLIGKFKFYNSVKNALHKMHILQNVTVG